MPNCITSNRFRCSGGGGSAVIGRACTIHRVWSAYAHSMSCGGPKCFSIRCAVATRLGHPPGAEPGERRTRQLRPPVVATIDDQVVCGDRSRHHRLAKPEAGVDHYFGAGAGDRVGGEGHAGNLGRHHPLDDHRHPDGGIVDATSLPVGRRPLGPQRRPASPHRVEQGRFALNVQERVLLSGEGRPRQILGRGTGADGDRAAAQIGVRGEDGLLDVGGDRTVPTGLGVGVGADHEARRHPYAGPDQLAEVGALAARRRPVVPTDLGQRPHPLLRPLLSTRVGHRPLPWIRRYARGECDVRRAAAEPGPRPAGSARSPRCAMRTQGARRRPTSPGLQPVRGAVDAHGERTLPDQQQVGGRHRVHHRAGAGPAGWHGAVQDLERGQAVGREQPIGSHRMVPAHLRPDRRAISVRRPARPAAPGG